MRTAAALLSDEIPVGWGTRLLPAAVCAAVVAWIDGEPARCGQAQATTFTARFISRYPDLALRRMDPGKAPAFKAWGVQIAEAFMGFPASICEAALAIPGGALARLVYAPKVPEVIAALELEARRRDLIRANALSHLMERERRAKLAEAEIEYESGRSGREQRLRHVQHLLRARAP